MYKFIIHFHNSQNSVLVGIASEEMKEEIQTKLLLDWVYGHHDQTPVTIKEHVNESGLIEWYFESYAAGPARLKCSKLRSTASLNIHLAGDNWYYL